MQASVDTVLRYIEDEITSGRMVAGDQVMPERELASHLGVSRTAVREAIRVFQAQGIMTSGVGRGPASGTRISPSPADALATLVRLHVELGGFGLSSIMETRIALETSSASLAADRATDEQLTEVAALARKMARPDLDLDGFNELDTEFHIAIAHMSGNDVVADLTHAVRVSVAAPIYRASRELEDWEAFRRRLASEHQALVDALRSRDPKRAAEIAEHHIRTAYSELFTSAETTSKTLATPRHQQR